MLENMKYTTTAVQNPETKIPASADKITCTTGTRLASPTLIWYCSTSTGSSSYKPIAKSQATSTPESPLPPSAESLSMSYQPYVKRTHPLYRSITNKITNSPTKRCAPHQISPESSNTTLAPLPSPNPPGTSIPVGYRSGVFPIEENRRRAGEPEKRTERQRMYTFYWATSCNDC